MSRKLILSTCLCIPLSAQAATLAPVVVTANNLEQPLSSVTSATHVLTREEIEEKGWETLAEALQHLPAVSMASNGGPGQTTTLYLRGQSGKGVLILMDGMPLADPTGTELAPHIENLRLDAVERIEVVQGPQSGIWGANASGGVINIITRAGSRKHFSIALGSENTRHLTATVSHREAGGDFSVSFASIRTDGFTALKQYDTSGTHDEDDAFEQTDFSLKAGINLADHHRIAVRIDRTRAETDFDSTTDPNSTVEHNSRDYTLKAISYRYQQDTIEARLRLSEYETDRASTSAFGTTRFYGNLTTHEGQLTWRYQPRSALQLAAGNQRIQGGSDAYWHDYVGLTHTHTFGPVSLVEAVRHDNYDRFKDATTGKIGFRLPILGLASLSANYGTGYNAPSAFQVGYGQTRNLKPESTTGWDVTLEGMGASLTYFDQETKDAIVYGGTWPNDYYTNADDKTTYRGWTLTYRRSFGQLAVGLNHTWLEARNDQGQLLARRPLREGSLTLDYYAPGGWHLGTVVRHVGDMYDTDGTSGTNLGNYTVVDASADYDLTRNMQVFVRLINLFDEDYYTAADRRNPPQYGYNTGGFQWRLGLRGRF